MMLVRTSPGQSDPIFPPEGPWGLVIHSSVFWVPAEICALRSFTFILSEVKSNRSTPFSKFFSYFKANEISYAS